MANNGKFLEKLVAIVEEVYRSNPETEILPNHKITNLDGAQREFDLIIRSSINDFYITIAIECKQYKGKVSVDKVEAFFTKCLSIPEIDKKVFVSENGFQQGAIDVAKRYGIELYTFAEIGQQLKQILPVSRMKPVFKGFEVLSAGCEYDGELPEINLSEITKFKSCNGTDNFTYYELIMEAAEPKWASLNICAILNHLKNGYQLQKIPFTAKFTGIFFEYNNIDIAIRQIDCIALIDIEFSEVPLIEKSYSHVSTGVAKATTLSFNLDNKVNGSIVMDKDEDLHFFDTTNKEIKKLEVLLRYDPETGQFEKPDKL